MRPGGRREDANGRTFPLQKRLSGTLSNPPLLVTRLIFDPARVSGKACSIRLSVPGGKGDPGRRERGPRYRIRRTEHVQAPSTSSYLTAASHVLDTRRLSGYPQTGRHAFDAAVVEAAIHKMDGAGGHLTPAVGLSVLVMMYSYAEN